MIGRMEKAALVSGCLLVFAIAGCKKPASDDNSGDAAQAASVSQGGSQFTGVEREASDAAFAEIAKHSTKGPDGWTTALTQGSPYSPDHFVRQYKQIEIGSIDADDLSDSDRLNGVQWRGHITFKPMPAREAGDPGMAFDGMAGVNRVKGRWSPWFDCSPTWMQLAKVKGQWQFNEDTTLLHGKPATQTDMGNAGVN